MFDIFWKEEGFSWDLYSFFDRRMKDNGIMDYKKYYKEIKDKLHEFSDVVYCEPLSNDEILEIEKSIGRTIKPLYREYLLAFGMTQDVFGELNTSVDSFWEEVDFIKDSLKDYLPISLGVLYENSIFLINNKDLQDDFTYSVKVHKNDRIGKPKKYKSFHKIIEESIIELENGSEDRCPNKDKVNTTEFEISGNDFPAFIDFFKAEGFRQKTEWRPKYYPENIFGSEVALCEIFDREIIFERDFDSAQDRFELEEPVLIDRENSIIRKAGQLLKLHGIKYTKLECNLIGNN